MGFGVVGWSVRRLIVGLIVCLSCLSLVSCNLNTPQIRVLRVATEPAFPPFEFRENGRELKGFSIDLIQAIARSENFTVDLQSLPFDGIIPALRAKTMDAAISSITITPKRAEVVDFSRPYFKSGLAIAIRADNQNIIDFNSLNNKKIAVQIGTTGAQKAKSITGVQVRSFDSTPLALQELSNGNVDAVIDDAPVILYAINTGNLSSIKIVKQLLTEEYYGIATAKNSPYLTWINRGLTKIIQNGNYQQIYQKWFKSTAPELPLTAINIPQNHLTISNSLSVILQSIPTLLTGVWVTLQLAFLSIIFGLISGSFIGIARLSPIIYLSWSARIYVDFFRGTPLLVQIFMIYFGLPAIFQEMGFTFGFNHLVAGVIALTLNSAAYIAEIVRAGIQSIEVGQAEAAQSLGLSSTQTMYYVILPQAFRRMIPPLGNEFISMLKDTSLVAVIGLEELFRKGQLIVADNYRAFEIYAAVAIIYLCLTLISSQAFTFLEKWMNPVKVS